MNIRPIGIYGPYPPAGKAASCYLIDNGASRIVLDLGCGALSALQKYVRPEDVDAYIVTHLHYDHCSDLLPLSYVAGKHTIYLPSSPSEFFSLVKARRNFDVRVIDSSLRFRIGTVGFEFQRSAHGVECYSVRVSEGDRFFVYTSDTAWSDRLIPFCRGAELVVADCCGKSGSPHMTPAEGGRLAKESGARVLAAHRHPAYDVSAALAAAGVGQIREGREIVVW